MEPADCVGIKFKTIRKRNVRQRLASTDDADDAHAMPDGQPEQNPAVESLKLSETRERQKLRHKPNGVNIHGLALGKKIVADEAPGTSDPFIRKTGGMANMQALKPGGMAAASAAAAALSVAMCTTDEAYDVGIGTQFSAETNTRDEDEEMMKYIEEQLSKRKQGIIDGATAAGDDDGDALKYLSPEEAALLALPDHLRISSSNRSEEMLSNQMLNGIPEVDLGIEAKIRNIEATEAAKEKLVQEQKNKADGPSHFVPTNMAVNFVQHNRFNLDTRRGNPHHQQQQRQQAQNRQSNANANGAPGKPGQGVKRATDDYHYDKFKKQFRRY